MAMLPIFIIGLVVGAGVTAIIMANLKNIPSAVKLTSLEDTINALKDDISLLENENKDLKEKLKIAKARKATTKKISSKIMNR